MKIRFKIIRGWDNKGALKITSTGWFTIVGRHILWTF